MKLLSTSAQRVSSQRHGDEWTGRELTVELDEDGHVDLFTVQLLLQLGRRSPRRTAGPGALDADPPDRLDARDLEPFQDLAGHLDVVLLLGRLELLPEPLETVLAVLLLRRLDPRLGVGIELVGQSGRGLADDRQARVLDEPPSLDRSAMPNRRDAMTHFFSSDAHRSPVHRLS